MSLVTGPMETSALMGVSRRKRAAIQFFHGALWLPYFPARFRSSHEAKAKGQRLKSRMHSSGGAYFTWLPILKYAFTHELLKEATRFWKTGGCNQRRF